jgi:hypothetical protein
MIALIALQSLASVADIHGLHQSGLQHLNFDHTHTSAHNLSENSDTQPCNLDCHHCCHCHGTVNVFLNASLAVLHPLQLAIGQTDYHISYTSYRPSPDNPPPIR